MAGQTICCAICPCCQPSRILRNTLQDPVSADVDPGSEKTEILSMDVSCLCRLVIHTDTDSHPNLGSSNLNRQRFK